MTLLPTSMVVRAEVSTEELVADCDELTIHDGSIDALRVEPVIAMARRVFNDDSSDIELDVTFSTADEPDLEVYSVTDTLASSSGAETYAFEEADLLTEGWSASTFAAAGDRSTTVTEVTASVEPIAPDTTVTVEVGGEITITAESSGEV